MLTLLAYILLRDSHLGLVAEMGLKLLLHKLSHPSVVPDPDPTIPFWS